MPMDSVGLPFSTLASEGTEHVALSAICSIERLRLRHAKRICSPTSFRSCDKARGSWFPKVDLLITQNMFYKTMKFIKFYFVLSVTLALLLMMEGFISGCMVYILRFVVLFESIDDRFYVTEIYPNSETVLLYQTRVPSYF